MNGVNIYGISFTDEEIKSREGWHDTTYLEYEIPVELENELSLIIEQKIKEFNDKCNCGLCKLKSND